MHVVFMRVVFCEANPLKSPMDAGEWLFAYQTRVSEENGFMQPLTFNQEEKLQCLQTSSMVSLTWLD